MTYDLVIGDRTYSSWSLRGWLLFARFGLPVRTRLAPLRSDDFARTMAEFAPARTVPTMRTPEGWVVQDSLAIAETLAERHPEAGLWPADPAARARARWLAAEMHSGFRALRMACPMNLAKAYAGFVAEAEVRADLDRIEALWAGARAGSGAGGPWLFGAYSAADAFFAPVAARIAGYELEVGEAAAAYVAAHLADPAFRRWRAMGWAEHRPLTNYHKPLPERPWPGPAVREARASDTGPALNPLCPYSGKPVTHYLVIGGRTYGFCTAFCRDKTLADPEAWPDFADVYLS
jgi:glutathione S-transferase